LFMAEIRKEEMMPDNDGYPTVEELNKIKNCKVITVKDFEILFTYIQSIWHWDDYAIKHDISHYELHTGGWSGNESIIAAMKDNAVLWSFACDIERRGGHYYFSMSPSREAQNIFNNNFRELKRIGAEMTRNKYNAQGTEFDGIWFDSKAEIRRYRELKLIERAGDISGLTVHPSFPLLPGQTWNGKKYRGVSYIADFMYREGDKIVVEDVKGGKATQTPLFRLKMKLWMSQHDEDKWDFRIIAT